MKRKDRHLWRTTVAASVTFDLDISVSKPQIRHYPGSWKTKLSTFLYLYTTQNDPSILFQRLWFDIISDMTSFRKYQQMTSPYVCSFLTSLMSAALLLLKVKKMQKHMQHLSRTSSAFVVWLSGSFELLFIKESEKRRYPDGKSDKNCTIITSHKGWRISKKSAVFARLVHVH